MPEWDGNRLILSAFPEIVRKNDHAYDSLIISFFNPPLEKGDLGNIICRVPLRASSPLTTNILLRIHRFLQQLLLSTKIESSEKVK